MAVTGTEHRYVPLSEPALAAALAMLPEWECREGRLVRRVVPTDLWRLLDQVCHVEDELDHHTVVELDSGTVTFAVWTHVCERLTLSDVELAQRIEALLHEY